MKIRVFACGLCKDKTFRYTRKGLREHLKTEHIRNNLFNTSVSGANKHATKKRQGWVYSKEL